MSNHHLLTLLCIITFLLSCHQGVKGDFRPHRNHHHHHTTHSFSKSKISKFFVFGDSYGDTGNNAISSSNSWKTPYGITYPKKPTGRYSNGRVMTDYIAKFIKLQTPISYRWRNVGYKQVKNGMNFADGGTGVFDTPSKGLNMTTQIGLLQQLINKKVYNKIDLQSSVALVTLSGNDYGNYTGPPQEWPSYIKRVVDQLAMNLEIIQKIGIKKVAVNALQPLGCIPKNTNASSFTQCNANVNNLVQYVHNDLLRKAVAKLNNNQTKPFTTFFVLDLYEAFMVVLNNTGSSRFENPLKPCCEGECGVVDENGVKKYAVCDRPDSSFFWDLAHPTQAGWKAVYSVLQHALKQFY